MGKDPMRILLTNDDGIDSPGIRALQTELALEHEVWLVAPDKEKSGYSQAISIRRPVRVRERTVREFEVDGTPVDCALVGLITLVPGKVDAVVSGINRGPNLGTDILYSGTVGAARQGAFAGIPAFALSLYDESGRFDFTPPAQAFSAALPRLAAAWSDDHFLNINFPARARLPSEWVVTFPARRLYSDYYGVVKAPDGSLHCSLQGDEATCHEVAGSDYEAVRSGLVSLSALPLHPVAHEKEARYRGLVSGERARA
jgi:5'-nucleotidase